MPQIWLVLWSTLPFLVLLSGANRCSVHDSSGSPINSELLDSLRCHNNYESFVQCQWRDDGDARLRLWFKTEKNREPCEPYGEPGPDLDGVRRCRYNTSAFSIGIKHTVFLLKEGVERVCWSVPRDPASVRQYLKARAPVDLSARDPGDGDRWLTWSSPYSSSSLNGDLTYELSYRSDRSDHWTTENVSNTSVKLPKRLLLPGHRYEARVRARVSVGQWSDWSPVTTWKVEEDPTWSPSLHCVLDGEQEVTCSWTLSQQLQPYITYELLCGHNHALPSERCCRSPTVTSGPDGKLKYSCSLTVTEPERLMLELQPTHTAKTFKASQHIHPKPPQKVIVTEQRSSWLVEWTEPSTVLKVGLFYQVCYHSAHDRECSTILNMPAGSTHLTLHAASLTPSQRYRVMVRSLVFPGFSSTFQGIPSEWTEPVEFSTHADSWSVTSLICVLIAVGVTAVSLSLLSVSPCQRKVSLWLDSVPSPGKSKILSEIQAAQIRTLQPEDTSHSVSACSTDGFLWPLTYTTTKCLEPEEGFWKEHHSTSTSLEEVNCPGGSSISFTGPYIFCQSSESSNTPVDVECEEEDSKTSQGLTLTNPVKFCPEEQGYVSLPNRTSCRSTEDLVSSSVSDANHSSARQDHSPARQDHSPARQDHSPAEQDQRCPDKTDVSEATGRAQPLAHSSGPFTSWPQDGTTQALGYCQLPQPS